MSLLHRPAEALVPQTAAHFSQERRTPARQLELYSPARIRYWRNFSLAR